MTGMIKKRFILIACFIFVAIFSFNFYACIQASTKQNMPNLHINAVANAMSGWHELVINSDGLVTMDFGSEGDGPKGMVWKKQISISDEEAIISILKKVNFFNLKNKYDKHPDWEAMPTCGTGLTLIVTLDNKTKKVSIDGWLENSGMPEVDRFMEAWKVIHSIVNFSGSEGWMQVPPDYVEIKFYNLSFAEDGSDYLGTVTWKRGKVLIDLKERYLIKLFSEPREVDLNECGYRQDCERKMKVLTNSNYKHFRSAYSIAEKIGNYYISVKNHEEVKR